MRKTDIWRIIEDFFLNCGSYKIDDKRFRGIKAEIDAILTPEYFEGVISNYRNEIRIGCFTKSADNLDMWQKYSNARTGFCIEYQTEKDELFRCSTLPVLYSDKPYNSSLSLACSIILDLYQKAKGRSLEENLKIFEPIYAKMLKIAYIPLFIKEIAHWSFEEEYRMFLLKHRNTQIEMLKSDEILDENYNINLSNAITSVYLGVDFEKNKNHGAIKSEIIQMAEEMKMKVFQQRGNCNKYINDRIF